MFDKDKPYNSLPKLPPKFDFDDVDILKAAYDAKGELANLNGQLLAAFSNYLNSYLFMSPLLTPEAVASSGVENIITTTQEVLEAKALPRREQTTEQKETISYEEALLLGQEELVNKGFLNTNDFLNIQQIVTPNKKGIRDMPGYKLANDKTGEVYYTPPEGVDLIRNLLKNFEEYFNDDKKDNLNPLVKVAILHYQFEAIHPFKDGNGRTGRILMPLYLKRSGDLSFPLVFISGYILKNRDQYYSLIRNVTSDNDWKPWILFILKAIEEQSKITWIALRKIRVLEQGYKDKIVKSNPSFRRLDLVDNIFIAPVFDVNQLAESLRIHPNTAKKYIDMLIDEDMIVSERYKNSKLYYNQKMLDLISETEG